MDATRNNSEARTGTVRAVTRAISVLRAFDGGARLELRDVASRAGLDRGTTRRLLLTLMEDGFIVQYANTGHYALGAEIRRLGQYADDVDLLQMFAPCLGKLASDMASTAFLSIYRDHSAVCLERCHNTQGLEVKWWPVGGTLPLHCGAATKLLLAWQDDEEIERVLAGPLSALTPKSIVDPDTLRRRLRLIRKRGWELAVDDVQLGLSALAVPILDDHGAMLGAVSIAGLTPQMVLQGKPVHLEQLQAAVNSWNRVSASVRSASK